MCAVALPTTRRTHRGARNPLHCHTTAYYYCCCCHPHQPPLSGRHGRQTTPSTAKCSLAAKVHCIATHVGRARVDGSVDRRVPRLTALLVAMAASGVAPAAAATAKADATATRNHARIAAMAHAASRGQSGSQPGIGLLSLHTTALVGQLPVFTQGQGR